MSIRDILIEESRRLDEIIAKATEDLKKAPEGSLVTRKLKGKVYFLLHDGTRVVYLSKTKDLDYIRALTQKAYARKVLRAACRQKAVLDRFLADYDPQAVSGVFADGRHGGMFTPYVEKPMEGEPFSFRPAPVLDLGLVSQMRDLCCRILGN